MVLNSSRNGTSTTSFSHLFRCLNTLWVKNFILTSNINLFSFSLKPLPVVLSLSVCVQSESPSCLWVPCKYWKVSPQPSLLCSEWPQLIGEVLQPFDHLRGPPLDPLQQLHLFLVPQHKTFLGPRPECSTPDGFFQGQSRGRQPPPSPCWPSHC